METTPRRNIPLHTWVGDAAVANNDGIGDSKGVKASNCAAVHAFGQVDGVVKNAGIKRDVVFHNICVADRASVNRVNVDGTFYVSNGAAWQRVRSAIRCSNGMFAI